VGALTPRFEYHPLPFDEMPSPFRTAHGQPNLSRMLLHRESPTGASFDSLALEFAAGSDRARLGSTFG
jgi:hypothetical protein